MNGNLMTIIGLFIMLAAFAGGWATDRIGSKRAVGLGGILSTVGGIFLVGTIWVPHLTCDFMWRAGSSG